MELTFKAVSAKDLHEQIHSFCKEFGIDGEHAKQAHLPLSPVSSVQPVHTAAVSAPAAAPPAAAAEPHAKRGRPKKAVATDFTDDSGSEEDSARAGEVNAAPAPVVHAQPTAAAAVVHPPLSATKQAVTDALTSVNGKHGLAIARGVLLKFGTDRLSSLAAERYPEFLGVCSKVTAAADLASAQALLA